MRNLRLKDNLSMLQLSEKINISETTIMHLEQNKIKIPYYYWKEYCNYFGVNHIEYLGLSTMGESSTKDKLIKLRACLGARNWGEVGKYIGYSQGFTIDLVRGYKANSTHLSKINNALARLCDKS